MSLRWAILGTGSQANSYFFQDGDTSLVIDNGFPLRTFRKRAAKAGLDASTVKTVLLTHTHGDHVRGLEDLVGTGALLVYRQGLKISNVLRRLKEPALMPVEAQTAYQVGGVDFLPFNLSHDAPLSTGVI